MIMTGMFMFALVIGVGLVALAIALGIMLFSVNRPPVKGRDRADQYDGTSGSAAGFVGGGGDHQFRDTHHHEVDASDHASDHASDGGDSGSDGGGGDGGGD
nr:MAG: hypothetical protein DWI10_09535 [Planctomycetota bacterium]